MICFCSKGLSDKSSQLLRILAACSLLHSPECWFLRSSKSNILEITARSRSKLFRKHTAQGLNITVLRAHWDFIQGQSRHWTATLSS